MSKSVPVNIDNEFLKLKFLKSRTPETTDEHAKDAFALLSEYRDGGIYIDHYLGNSQWERHCNGDEFVHVLDGKTALILLINTQEQTTNLTAGEFLVVPKGIWHSFEAPKGVKVMMTTPLPTDYSIELPIKPEPNY